MANAVIGALRVNLGIDTAQFSEGLTKANVSLAKFAKVAAAGFAAAAAGATALATALAMGLKSTIDRADEMSKMASKFGVPTEELYRLGHAAGLSGVSIESLGASLRKLSQNMQETANGAKNTASQAFGALGIAVKNSDGTLKSSSQVMTEVAEKFSRMEDGAQKTAIAVAIFGRAGTDLIPMLNAGKAGLADMLSEADRLGIVISGHTAKAAEAFNDNLTRLGTATQSLFAKLAEQLLPALEMLSEKFMDFVNNEGAITAAASGISQTFMWLAREIGQLSIISSRLNAEIRGLMDAFSKLSSGEFSGAWESFTKGQQASAQMRDEMNAMFDSMENGIGQSQGGIQRRIDDAFGTAGTGTGEKFVANFSDAVAKGGAKVKAAIDPMIAEATRVFDATRTPLENYQAQIAKLNDLLAAGYINQDTYNRAVIQAQDAFDQASRSAEKNLLSLEKIGKSIARTIGGAFQGLIDGSKKLKDVLADVLSQLGNMLINSAFQSITGGLFGGGGGIKGAMANVASGTFSGFYANGTNSARAGLAVVGERGPELVQFGGGERVIPNNELGGGGTVVHFAPRIDARGASVEAVERLSVELQKMQRDLPSLIDGRTATMRSRNFKMR